jgi:transposase-like protein
MMKKKRRFTAAQKVSILREHLENQVSISELADKHEIAPTMIYQWKKQLFEGALSTFETRRKSKGGEQRKIEKLQSKLQDRNNVILEIVAENVTLKKNLDGET